MKRKNNHAQSFLEYSILIGVLVAALVGMRVFMVRAVSERYRQSADIFGQGEQYEPGVTQVLVNSYSSLPQIDPEDPCPGVEKAVTTLNSQIAALELTLSDPESGEGLEQSKANIEAQIAALTGVASITGLVQLQIDQLKEQLAELKKRIAAVEADIQTRKDKIAQYQGLYPDCPVFGGS